MKQILCILVAQKQKIVHQSVKNYFKFIKSCIDKILRPHNYYDTN